MDNRTEEEKAAERAKRRKERPDKLTRVINDLPRDRAMYAARHLGSAFDVGVVIVDAELATVALDVTGQSGEAIEREEAAVMRGYLRGLFARDENRKGKGGFESSSAKVRKS